VERAADFGGLWGQEHDEMPRPPKLKLKEAGFATAISERDDYEVLLEASLSSRTGNAQKLKAKMTSPAMNHRRSSVSP